MMTATQKIPAGYKQTEIGVIPEDWEVKRLKDLCIEKGLVRGPFGGALKKEYFVNKGVKVYEQKNAIYRSCEIGDYYIDNNKYLELKRFELKPNDFIVSCSGTIGKIYLIPSNAPKGIINQALLKITTNNAVVSKEYFLYYFEWEKFQERIIDNTQGGAMKNLVGMSIFRETLIPVPLSTIEQKVISTALSDIITLISKTETLIGKKKNIKQGAMQELLTGRRRLLGFNGTWEVKKLGNIGSFSKGQGIRKDQAQRGDIPCIRYGELYTKHRDYIKKYYSFISKKVAATARKLKSGDILFAGSGETKEEIGKCAAFVENIEAYAGGDVVILSPDNADSLFLGYLLNTPLVVRQKASKGQGDAIVHISAQNLKEVEIIIPADKPEQTAIAAILSDMDAEIEKLEAQLTKYQNIKQGMMQTLLTGKIRLI